MEHSQKIFIAGHRGLVGSALVRNFTSHGYTQLITRTRAELDLRDPHAVDAFFRDERPDAVVVASAKVGGIQANNEFPVDFLLHNLQIQNNLIASAHEHGVERLLFLGSSCIYPKFAEQPMREDSLLTGALEPTNEPYAIAKIAGIKLCQSYWRQYGRHYISAMPTNLYGPGDNFDLSSSHVLPALLRKVHEAKIGDASEVMVWGTGSPRREFLHTDDLADACRILLERHTDPMAIVNIGCGEDVTIRELAETICDVVGFDGKLVFDTSKPDGTPRKLLDISRMRAHGWAPAISLREGIASVYTWFLKNVANV